MNVSVSVFSRLRCDRIVLLSLIINYRNRVASKEINYRSLRLTDCVSKMRTTGIITKKHLTNPIARRRSSMMMMTTTKMLHMKRAQDLLTDA